MDTFDWSIIAAQKLHPQQRLCGAWYHTVYSNATKAASSCNKHRSHVKATQGWLYLGHRPEVKGNYRQEGKSDDEICIKLKWLMSSLCCSRICWREGQRWKKVWSPLRKGCSQPRGENSAETKASAEEQVNVELCFALNLIYPSIQGCINMSNYICSNQW